MRPVLVDGPVVAGSGELHLTSALGARVCGFRGKQLVVGTAKKLALRRMPGLTSDYGNGALFANGRLWIYGEGLYAVSKDDGATLQLLDALPRFASTDANAGYVRSMAVADDGTLFILGIEDGRASYFVARTGDGKKLDGVLTMKKTYLDALHGTPHGVFAVGGDGLYRCDAKKLTRVITTDDKMTHVGHAGSMLAAVGPYAGLHVSHNGGKRFTRLDLPAGIRPAVVVALDEQHLILGGNHGVHAFDLATNALTPLRPTDAYPSGRCRSAIRTDRGALLVAAEATVLIASLAAAS